MTYFRYWKFRTLQSNLALKKWKHLRSGKAAIKEK